MKKTYFLITIALFLSLFIYLFYRTENTVVNELFMLFLTPNKYFELKKSIRLLMPLNQFIVFSLPEGLWVLSITLTSKQMFVKLINKDAHLVFAPLIFSVGLELLQFFKITNGKFDFWDILVSFLFWIIATYLFKSDNKKQYIFKPFSFRSFICILSYSIVYFAHVWK